MKQAKRILCMLIAVMMLVPLMMISTPAEGETAKAPYIRKSSRTDNIIYFDNVNANVSGLDDKSIKFQSGTTALMLHNFSDTPAYAPANDIGFGIKVSKNPDGFAANTPFCLQIISYPMTTGVREANYQFLSIRFKAVGVDAAHSGSQTAPHGFYGNNDQNIDQLKPMTVTIENDKWITWTVDRTDVQNWQEGNLPNDNPWGGRFYNICLPTLNDDAYYVVDYFGFFASKKDADAEAAEQNELWEGAPALPTFSLAAGKYYVAKTVELSTVTEGAKIYYTTDGTEPTKDSIAYTAPIVLEATATLKAISYNPANGKASAVAERAYEIDTTTCAAPVFSTIGKTVPANCKVTITSETEGAKIYYTTDGSEPTAASTLYTAPITVTKAQTIKAIAVMEGKTNSAAATAEYTKILPEFYYWSFENLLTGDRKGNFTAAQGVYHNDSFPTIYCDESGHTNDAFGGLQMVIKAKTGDQAGRSGIRLHPDAGDVPENKPLPNANYHYMVIVYKSEAELTLTWRPNSFNGSSVESDAVTLPKATTYTKVIINMDETNETWKTYAETSNHFAINFKNNSDQPVNASFLYAGFFMDEATAQAENMVGMPIPSKKAGDYESAIKVELNSATEGAKIYYTTDGSTPTENSTLYTSAIDVEGAVTIKAVAIKDGKLSEVMTYEYKVTVRVKQPEIDLKAGKYEGEQTVKVTTATEGAKIYYTTDGSTPSATNGTLYEGEIKLSKSCILKVIAVKEGMEDSEVSSRTYNIVVEENTTGGSDTNDEFRQNTEETKKGSKGCSSSVSFCLLALIGTVSMAGYALAKKKED